MKKDEDFIESFNLNYSDYNENLKALGSYDLKV